jgi:uncharacterized protein
VTRRRAPIFLVICAIAACLAIVATGVRLASPTHATVGPAPVDLNAERVEFRSGSTATLRGWFVAGQPGGGAVVLMHGVHANRLSMVPRARFLREHGYSVLLFDFQAHGESSGDWITFGRREALDAQAAVDFARQRLPGERVAAIGSSLGGAAALLGPHPLAVDALVLEAVYPEIGAALDNRFRAVLGPLAGEISVQLAAPLLKIVMPSILGIRLDDLRPIDHVGAVTAPILIASGTKDTRTTLAEARALFDRANAPKQFWAVEGAGHVDLEAYAPEEYRRRVLAFLQSALRPQ